MRCISTAACLAAAALPLCALAIAPANAHVIAGDRVFPVTLTIDDPGVSDEVSIPAFTYSRSGSDGGAGPGHEFDFGFEYDKTITPTTALILNGGYDFHQMNGAKSQAGFENLYVTGKWQAYTNAAHEFVASLGIIREIGGTGTAHTGGDRYGSTAPTAYFGKGLGDLPIGFARPLADHRRAELRHRRSQAEAVPAGVDRTRRPRRSTLGSPPSSTTATTMPGRVASRCNTACRTCNRR